MEKEHSINEEAIPQVSQPTSEQQSSRKCSSSSSGSPTPPPSSRPDHHGTSSPAYVLQKKSKFLQRPKVLYVGDSVSHNVNFADLEKKTNSRIKTTKAYSSVKDATARWPHKNIIEVSLIALVNTHEEDEYTHLVLGAPTADITNMDKSKLKSNDNIEVFKQNVFISCENVFSATQNALSRHSKLKKVSMMEHATRFDRYEKDPTG